MQLNKLIRGPRTHEKAPASVIKPVEQLRRSVLSTLLWEDGFYEDGEAIAERIIRLAKICDPTVVGEIMVEAKFGQKLRHAPLLLAVALAETGGLQQSQVDRIITRADDLTELLALYWRAGRKPIDHQLRKGLALAFRKFDAYQLAKYDRRRQVRLRDVLRMVRPKPENPIQAELWGRLVRSELASADTWENALSRGQDKQASFERLLRENRLGDLAFLRNLRSMAQAGVDKGQLKASIKARTWKWQLPFQFIVAARMVPEFEPELEIAMLKSLQGLARIEGKVAILVDGSGSMQEKLSARSDLTRFDAACGLAILVRELCNQVEVYRFNDHPELVPARRGFALRDALGTPNGGTALWKAVRSVGSKQRWALMLVISDEQTNDQGNSSEANAELVAVLNVSHTQHGVGYGKGTIHINGWSENVIRYVSEYRSWQAR